MVSEGTGKRGDGVTSLGHACNGWGDTSLGRQIRFEGFSVCIMGFEQQLSSSAYSDMCFYVPILGSKCDLRHLLGYGLTCKGNLGPDVVYVPEVFSLGLYPSFETKYVDMAKYDRYMPPYYKNVPLGMEILIIPPFRFVYKGMIGIDLPPRVFCDFFMLRESQANH